MPARDNFLQTLHSNLIGRVAIFGIFPKHSKNLVKILTPTS